MRGVDVPQTNDLDQVVRAVKALRDAASTTGTLATELGLSERHAGYALHSARVLGFAVETEGGWILTDRGKTLCDAPAYVVDDVLRDAVEASGVLVRLAPQLLGSGTVTHEGLTRAIQNHAGLAVSTAARRARSLLTWRKRLLEAPSLFSNTEHAPYRTTSDDLALCRVDVRNYGPLRSVHATLGHCTVIIGRNGTGKSTFLDALGFLSDALEGGIESAWRLRAPRWHDLLWYSSGDCFDLVLEVRLPINTTSKVDRSVARYELSIGVLKSGGVGVLHEMLYLKPDRPAKLLLNDETPKRWLRVLAHGEDRAAYFHAEQGEWKTIFKLSSDHLALAHVQPSPERFGVTLRLRDFFSTGVTLLALSANAMRRPCSPRLTGRLRRDGENLPLRVDHLRTTDPFRFKRWILQVREALPNLRGIEVEERAEDRHRYLVVQYDDGLKVPAWRLSDGTLRILALTLLGYLDEDALILVEEPENGIHPRAVEAVYEALGSAPRTQVLVATHSPVLLGIVPPADLLCFIHEHNETEIIRGSDHPLLRTWKHEVDIGTLFASGVLE